MQEHRYQVDALVTERTTGVRGVVIDRKWFVDLRPPVKPATPAYLVHFADGRRKNVLDSELD